MSVRVAEVYSSCDEIFSPTKSRPANCVQVDYTEGGRQCAKLFNVLSKDEENFWERQRWDIQINEGPLGPCYPSLVDARLAAEIFAAEMMGGGNRRKLVGQQPKKKEIIVTDNGYGVEPMLKPRTQNQTKRKPGQGEVTKVKQESCDGKPNVKPEETSRARIEPEQIHARICKGAKRQKAGCQ
jgi:hypothetical protein